MKFLFDLDGTVTSVETLPIISQHFNCTEQIAELTALTVQGNVPFIESFIRRVNILGGILSKKSQIYYQKFHYSLSLPNSLNNIEKIVLLLQEILLVGAKNFLIE